MIKKTVSGALALTALALTAGANPASAGTQSTFDNCPSIGAETTGAASDCRVGFIKGWADSVNRSTYRYEYLKSGVWTGNNVSVTADDGEQKNAIMITGIRGGTPIRVRATNCVRAVTKY